jgi:hypothetical protein
VFIGQAPNVLELSKCNFEWFEEIHIQRLEFMQSVDWSGEQIQTHLFNLLDNFQNDMCMYHVYQIFEGVD